MYHLLKPDTYKIHYHHNIIKKHMSSKTSEHNLNKLLKKERFYSSAESISMKSVFFH